jgi:hypothetical protein
MGKAGIAAWLSPLPKRVSRYVARSGRDPMVSSRIPAPTDQEIDEWAERNETTRSDAIRRLVEIGLKAKGK